MRGPVEPGAAHEEQGSAAAPARHSAPASRSDPFDEIFVRFTDVLTQCGGSTEADGIRRAAAALGPEQPGHRRVRTMCTLGRALEEKGRLPDAESVYRAALDIAPRDAECHFQIGRVMRRTDRPARAEHHLREAQRLDPDLPGVDDEIAALDARWRDRPGAAPPGPDRSQPAVILRERIAALMAHRRD